MNVMANVAAPYSFATDVKLRLHCQKRREAMIRVREPWMPDWRQVSEYVDPGRGRFADLAPGDSAEGKRSRSKILNNTATRAVRVATAGMSSHMTSKSRPWFQLQTPSPELNELYDVRVWLDDVTEIIRDTLAKSNFYKAMPVMYAEDILYGIACMLSAQDDEEVVRFFPMTVGTYAISLGPDGKVDGLWRSWRDTAKNIVNTYGRQNVPTSVLQACECDVDRWFVLEALIEKNPNPKRGMGPMDLRGPLDRAWREVIWINGATSDPHGVLKIGGHYEQPFVCIRWNPVGDEVYSTSPCVDSLGDIKQLQYREGQSLKITDLIAEPPLGLPGQMRNKPASLSPGAKLYLPDNMNGAQAQPVYSPPPQASREVREDIATVVDRINATLFVPLFLMMETLGDQTGRTAAEIYERRDEKAAVLGPTLEVVTDEGLDPTIIRTYGLLDRAGRIPPAPPALNGIPLKIEYTSILAQAVKAAGTAGMERGIAFAANLVAVTKDPTIFDKIDSDQAIDEYMEAVGAPARIVRSDEAVAAMRAQRAQQQQVQQLAAMAKPASDAATAYKTLSETVPQDGSAAEGLANVLGQSMGG